jgi:hypothetical protein
LRGEDDLNRFPYYTSIHDLPVALVSVETLPLAPDFGIGTSLDGVEVRVVSAESCGICGGDGRIANSFGSTTSCPGCRGSGRKSTDTSLFHDVTKTKPSHHQRSNKNEPVVKPTWPTTFEGGNLANEVRDSGSSSETKARLIREIMDYEGTHPQVTQTFTKKIRKQIRPAS